MLRFITVDDMTTIAVVFSSPPPGTRSSTKAGQGRAGADKGTTMVAQSSGSNALTSSSLFNQMNRVWILTATWFRAHGRGTRRAQTEASTCERKPRGWSCPRRNVMLSLPADEKPPVSRWRFADQGWKKIATRQASNWGISQPQQFSQHCCLDKGTHFWVYQHAPPKQGTRAGRDGNGTHRVRPWWHVRDDEPRFGL